MWNKTLDPQSPDFKFTEAIEVAASDGLEDNDAIDPGLLLDPTTGRLWEYRQLQMELPRSLMR